MQNNKKKKKKKQQTLDFWAQSVRKFLIHKQNKYEILLLWKGS